MARFSLRSLPENQRVQLIAEFYTTIASLKNRNEVRAFFRDLLTGDEIAMLMRRIEAATLILSGYSGHSIREITGIGKEAIHSIKTKLSRSDRGEGYRVVADRLLTARKKMIQKNRHNEQRLRSPWKRLKNQYKTYHLLDHILDEIIDYKDRKSNKKLARSALDNTPSRKRTLNQSMHGPSGRQ